jgi:hypothetical protein
MTKRLRIVFIILFMVVNFAACSSHSADKLRPYLQAVTHNSIYVLVETGSAQPVTVEYGKTPDYGERATSEKIEATTASPGRYVHKIKLSGLQSDTLYHYRVFPGETDSADQTFWTASNPGTNFRFAWMADCRGGISIHDIIAGRIKDANPRFSLYGGDLCSDSSYRSFQQEFFRPNELALIANVPFFNATGNHELWSKNTKAFTQAPDSPSGDQGYYSFDYGDLHVLVLNYMEESRHNITGSAQYQFAISDLQSSNQTWKIVACHSPAFCAGGHGEDKVMKVFTKDIFEPARVDMVIAGHSHFYQHNLVNGIHHMVIGSAGAEPYYPKSASYTIKSLKDYNYAIADVSPAALNMTVYNERGVVLDTVNLVKN